MMQITKKLVTPTLAKRYLADHECGRRLDKKRVLDLIIALKNKEWITNGDAIRFNQDQRMFDGQHRCMAIVESGISAKTLIIQGLPNEAFKTFDIGKKRTSGDVLDCRGYKYATTLASSIKWYQVISQANKKNKISSIYTHINITPTQALDFINKNPKLYEFVLMVRNMNRDGFFNSSILSSLCYLALKKHRYEYHELVTFLNRLCKGVDLKEGSAIHIARQKFIKIKADKIRITYIEHAAMLLKTLSAFQNKRRIKKLSWNQNSGEKFPTF